MRRLILILAFAGCAQTQPPPIAPLIDPYADPFTSQVFDCNGIDTSAAVPLANACADEPGTGSCLVRLVRSGTPINVLACAVGNAEITANAAVKQGTADKVTANRAEALQYWLTVEGVMLRNKWCP
jgi:hypothetical protein